MFRIMDRDFADSSYGNERCLQNWPMLYILEDGRQAYIGQSTHAAARMAEHKANDAKQGFKAVHFIYSDKFNQSVTLDFESKLIQLFAADNKYILMNGNNGIADKDYYNKLYYDGQFPELWERLRKRKLVIHSIDEIVNSDLFKYSPYKELNENQRQAVDEILDMISRGKEGPVIVSGQPGSGKTIVAVFLMKRMKDMEEFRGKKIGLVIPQTSLRKTLKELFRHIYGLKASDVIGPSDAVKSKFDILLVDEAHRLHLRKNIPNMGAHDANNRQLGLSSEGSELDWVLMQSASQVLFYDGSQVVGPSGIQESYLKDKVRKQREQRNVQYYTLLTQMRVKGGKEYVDYVDALLHDRLNVLKYFPEYEFKIISQFHDFVNLMMEKEQNYGLSRMVAGYAWPWISKKDKSQKDICIEGISRMWNNRTENWVHCETAIDEVGCIHSIQGYDLNYAFVILGNDIFYDCEKKKICIDRTHYYDRNGKATASDEELSEYIRNIYYVLMTRGIRGTFLYVCDRELKNHLSDYVEVIN